MMELSERATDSFKFKIEEVLDDQSIEWSLPFPDMDKVLPAPAVTSSISLVRPPN